MDRYITTLVLAFSTLSLVNIFCEEGFPNHLELPKVYGKDGYYYKVYEHFVKDNKVECAVMFFPSDETPESAIILVSEPLWAEDLFAPPVERFRLDYLRSEKRIWRYIKCDNDYIFSPDYSGSIKARSTIIDNSLAKKLSRVVNKSVKKTKCAISSMHKPLGGNMTRYVNHAGYCGDSFHSEMGIPMLLNQLGGQLILLTCSDQSGKKALVADIFDLLDKIEKRLEETGNRVSQK